MAVGMLTDLVRVLGSPFVDSRGLYASFSVPLYRLAQVNRVALTYLSRCACSEGCMRLREYHGSRFKALAGVLCRVSKVLELHGFRYAVFKTIRPFEEDVADIDILYLGDDEGYRELVDSLSGSGLRVMESSPYSTTFMDPRYRFSTELMVDVYREVSAGPLVYLDKGILANHTLSISFQGCRVRVLDSVGEALATIAHSVVKEREVKLLDYLTALYLAYGMDAGGARDYAGLARRSGLVYASRLFFSVVVALHGRAYGSIPERLAGLLNSLGGAVYVGAYLRWATPPYRIGLGDLARVFKEKIHDPRFRESLTEGLAWFAQRRSWLRAVEVLRRH